MAKRFTEEEIERGLLALVATRGNTRKAAALLAGDGLKVDHSTIWRWGRRQPGDGHRFPLKARA